MKTRILIISAGLIALASGLCFADETQPYLNGYEEYMQWRLERNQKAYESLSSNAEHNYDVKAYYIDLFVDPVGEYIQGYCTVTMESIISGLTEVELDLRSLTVTSCGVNGDTTTFNQDYLIVTIDLPTPMNPGTDFDVSVYYQGNPVDGMYFDTAPLCAFTLTEPTESRYWYPCYDDPEDKADYCDVVITVKGDYVVAGNGVEIQREYTNGRTVSHWRESYPIPTYLIAVAICDYSVLNDDYQGMPLVYYVYPGEESDAWITFEHHADLFDFFSSVFGPYPFTTEKYAVAELPFGGGMEHTTTCFLGDYFIQPSHDSDWIIGHELSHQWWGDWVTCGTWKDIWLNEGFATYCDALFYQYYYGEASFQSRMEWNKLNYFEEDAELRFPIYDPVYMWGATVYEKGSWIMHMMRRVFNDDDAYYQMLRNYGSAHAYGTAITKEFQVAVEAGYSDNFSWFFDEWVYLAGYPEIEYGWTANGNTVTLIVEQVQEVDELTPLFQMPVDIRLTTTQGEEDFEIWMSQDYEVFELNASAEVTDLEFDPDNWLLCTKEEVIDVELRYFTAWSDEPGVTLYWEVACDEPIYGFNLYRRLANEGSEQKNLPTPLKSNVQPADVWLKVNDQVIDGENPYSYLDGQVEEGIAYEYKLEVVLSAGPKPLGNTEVVTTTPQSFALMQNYPNPWSDKTMVTFTLPTDDEVSLQLFDITGRLVKEVASGYYQSGEHQVTLDSYQLESGIYILRLANEEQSAFRKVVLVK